MRPATVAGAALVAALLAGCSGEQAATPLEAGGPAATGGVAAPTSAPAATPSVDPAVAKVVVADYLRYWTGVLAAHAGRDPRAPLLRRYAAGTAYDRVAAAVRTNASRGYLRKGTVAHVPTVTAVDGATARVRDCADVTKWAIYSVRTGRRVPIGAAEPRLETTYQLERKDGRWMVAEAADGGGC